MARDRVRVKQYVSLEEVVTYLEELTAALRDRTVCLQRGEKVVVLTPVEPIKLHVEASQHTDREKLEFKITWRPGGADEPAGPLRIGASLPGEQEEQ